MATTISSQNFLPTELAAALAVVESQALRLVVAADATAGTATAETIIGTFTKAGTLDSIKNTAITGVSSSDSNYATLTYYLRDGAGGSPVTLATLTTKTVSGSGGGDWTACVAKSVGTLASTAVTAGSILSYAIGKASGGVSLPVFEILAKIDL